MDVVGVARVGGGAWDFEAYVGEGAFVDDVFGFVAVELLTEAGFSFHDGGHIFSGVSTVEAGVREVVHIGHYGAYEVFRGEEGGLLVGELDLVLDGIVIAFSYHIG